MIEDIKPGDEILNRDLSINNSGYVILFVRLVILEDKLRAKNIEMFSSYATPSNIERINADISSDTDYTLQSVISSMNPDTPIYRLMVPAGSDLQRQIKSGTTALSGFSTFPQIILYKGGRPYKYLNGDLTDKYYIIKLLTDVSVFRYFDKDL